MKPASDLSAGAQVARPAERAPRRDSVVVLGLVMVTIGLVAGFVVTSIGAAHTGELGVDVSISQHRDGVLSAIALFVNVALGPVVAPLVLLIVCGFLWTRDRFLAVTVGGLTIVGWLSVEIGKALVHRTRPPGASVHALVSETAADSYPSGHTAFAAAAVFAVVAALVLRHRSTRLAWLVGLPFIAVVALSRLYLGVHYVTDVIASVVFAGSSILVVVAIGWPWLARLRDREAART